MLRSTGRAGNPKSYFHTPPLDAWLKAFDLTPGPTVEASLISILYAAITEGTLGGIFGARLQRHSFDFFMEQLTVLFPEAQSDAQRLGAAFGEITYVHLLRQDKVAQAVSLVRARQTGLWHRHADGSELERLAPHADPVYDPEAIQAELDDVTALDQAWQDWFTAEGIAPISLTYEDLAQNPGTILGDLFVQLGLPRETKVTPGTAKLADKVSADWTARFCASL